MWNERFAGKEYVYGEAPNHYFKTWIAGLKPGKLLLPAEGEGRNAVFAASLGWDVLAFDSSYQAKAKALKLAEKKGVRIEYKVSSFEAFDMPSASFDAMALIFAHIHKKHRQDIHRKLMDLVKSGGHVFLKAFAREQLNYTSGGPPELDLLYGRKMLEEDFKMLTSFAVRKGIIELDEGRHHRGPASIVWLTGQK